MCTRWDFYPKDLPLHTKPNFTLTTSIGISYSGEEECRMRTLILHFKARTYGQGLPEPVRAPRREMKLLTKCWSVVVLIFLTEVAVQSSFNIH